MVAAAVTDFNIQWHITERCNCRCAHCYQESNSIETPLDKALRYIEMFKKFLPPGSGRLTVTGGEPLLHPGLWSILEALRPHFSVALLTNGTLITPEIARRLAGLDLKFVQVSIEGRPETHDKIRGPGSYTAAMDGLNCLIRENVKVSVSFTAHRTNWRELPSVVKQCRKIGARKIWVDRLIPQGSGTQMISLDPDETRRLLISMRKNDVSMDRALQFLEGGRPYVCSAGKSLLAVLPDGTVVPCRRMPIPLGNLDQQRIEDIYRSDYCTSLRETRCKGCERCLYVNICDGGLRCLAYAVNGDPFTPDPGCWIARSIAENQ